MNKLIFFIIGIMALMPSCKDLSIEPDQTGQAIFELSGEVDGQGFTFIAGEDGYFQNTSFEKNELNQLELSGTLEEVNCNNSCKSSLQIILKAGKVESQFSDYLIIGTKTYFKAYEAPEEFMIVKLFSNPNGNGPFTYQWDLGDGRVSSLANPRVVYQDRNPKTVKLTTTDQSGCSSSQTREVNMHPGTNECSILLTPPAICNDSSGNIIYCVKAIAVGGQAPYQITYDNNTFNTSILNIPLTDFPANDLCVSVTDATGSSANTCGNINLSTSSPSGTQSCNTQFTYQSDLEEIPFDSLQSGTVEVIYTNENGEVFSSANANGSSINQFNLTGLIPYQRNNAGQKTSIAKISFSCALQSDSGNEILIENAIGSFGFAHPD